MLALARVGIPINFNGVLADYGSKIVDDNLLVTHIASGVSNVDLLHLVEVLSFDTGLDMPRPSRLPP